MSPSDQQPETGNVTGTKVGVERNPSTGTSLTPWGGAQPLCRGRENRFQGDVRLARLGGNLEPRIDVLRPNIDDRRVMPCGGDLSLWLVRDRGERQQGCGAQIVTQRGEVKRGRKVRRLMRHKVPHGVQAGLFTGASQGRGLLVVGDDSLDVNLHWLQGIAFRIWARHDDHVRPYVELVCEVVGRHAR